MTNSLFYIIMDVLRDSDVEDFEEMDVKLFISREEAIEFCRSKMEPLMEENEEICIEENGSYITIAFPGDNCPTYFIYKRSSGMAY